MRFTFTQAQRQTRKAFFSLGSEIATQTGDLSPGAYFENGVWSACGLGGLLGLCLPDRYGGGGKDALETALAIEGFAQGCEDMGLCFGAAAHLLACAVPIMEFGSDALREQCLPKLASGAFVGANAITEKGAGSDVFSYTARAVRDGEGWILNSEKSFVTNGPFANVIIVYAVTNPKAGYLGHTAFAVFSDTPGLERSPSFGKRGLKSAAAGEVYCRECRIPNTQVLGKPGQGALIFKRSMLWERSCLFAAYLGLMERAIAESVKFAQTREQFGRPIAKNQAVSHRLVDMKLALESARLLVYRACDGLAHNRGRHLDTALSKLAVSEAAVQVCEDAVRLHGGWAVMTENTVGSHLWDALPALTFSGTPEVMRDIVAGEMGL